MRGTSEACQGPCQRRKTRLFAENVDLILMQEIKKYPSAGRMLLTGTPLHVSVVRFLLYAISVGFTTGMGTVFDFATPCHTVTCNHGFTVFTGLSYGSILRAIPQTCNHSSQVFLRASGQPIMFFPPCSRS